MYIFFCQNKRMRGGGCAEEAGSENKAGTGIVPERLETSRYSQAA